MKYKFIQLSYLNGWFIASVLWYLIRNSVIPIAQSYSWNILVFFMITWLSQGLLYGTLFFIINKYLGKRILYYRLLLLSVITQLSVAFLITSLIYPMLQYFKLPLIQQPSTYINFITMPVILFGTIYAFFVNGLISMVISINLMIGKSTLASIMTGKYYYPIVEKRIFMFIDLKSSTSLAEKLGHKMFSQLIQDCFYELSVFNQFSGDIHKYVGDEAIISWKVNYPTSYSIASFFAYKAKLQQKEQYFNKEYEVIPEFKAGIHWGEITVMEIGNTKREIAFLGDTMNTTARIQNVCNEYDAELLISEDVFKRLNSNGEWDIEKICQVHLKGKENDLEIYSVHQRELSVT